MDNTIIATMPSMSEKDKKWICFLNKDFEYTKLCDIKDLYYKAFTPLEYQLSRSRSMRVLDELHKCEKYNDTARTKLNELIEARVAILRKEFERIN